ncbi:MAG: PAS domain-containing protein [Betaproteobacteria bacterium]|nr:PAS domain-containing protein [Betaproteobacteria bacterium]
MTWITFLWPTVTGACITIGLIHFGIGLSRDRGTPHMLFALTALSFAVFSVLELAMMLAHSPEQFLELQRWADFVGAAGAVSLAAFVWVFFATGRKWLALLGSGLVCAPLMLDVSSKPKLIFLEITGIRTVETFGGASFAVAEGTRNPWVAAYYLGVLLIAVFVADASVALWRRGGRRRAALVGGTITFFILTGGVQAWLVDAGILRTPYFVSFFYLVILVAMAIELSAEVLQASQLARDLRESEQRLNMAADAANLGLWAWEVESDEIWITSQGRTLFGFAATERIDRNRFFAAVHPDDREFVRQAVADSLRADADYEREYRTMLPDGKTRWVAVRGNVERDDAHRAVRVRGVAMDITARKEAEEAANTLSGRLIHAQEAERTRLARELHDDLNQSLALLAVELELFGQKPPPAGRAFTGRMQELAAMVRNLSSGVHRLSHELHPAKLEQLGLVAAVRGFCRELGAAHRLEIEFEPHEVPRSLPDDIALCVYRVVQEGLQNVVKHSGANGAKVELTASENELCIVVSDHGRGFDAAKKASYSSLGLVSMRERVRLVRGNISIESRRGEGTRIRAQVPLQGLIG